MKIQEFTTSSIGENAVLQYGGSDCAADVRIVLRIEAVQAVVDFFAGRITKQEATAAVVAYFTV